MRQFLRDFHNSSGWRALFPRQTAHDHDTVIWATASIPTFLVTVPPSRKILDTPVARNSALLNFVEDLKFNRG